MARMRQSRPDAGLGFQVEALETFAVVPFPLGACEDRLGTGPPRARTEVIYVDLGYWAISGRGGAPSGGSPLVTPHVRFE